MGSTSSRGRGNVRKRSDLSSTSEELIAAEKPPSPSKRQLEGQAEESEAVRPRTDVGTGEVEERPDKFQATRVKVRSVKDLEKFLRREEPKYHIDEDVELDESEFDEMETNVGSDAEEVDYASDGEKVPEEAPTW